MFQIAFKLDPVGPGTADFCSNHARETQERGAACGDQIFVCIGQNSRSVPQTACGCLLSRFHEQSTSWSLTPCFRGGDTSVKDKARSGRPSSVNTDANRALLHANLDADCRHSIRRLSEDTGINRSTMLKVLKKSFGMSKVAPSLFHEF